MTVPAPRSPSDVLVRRRGDVALVLTAADVLDRRARLRLLALAGDLLDAHGAGPEALTAWTAAVGPDLRLRGFFLDAARRYRTHERPDPDQGRRRTRRGGQGRPPRPR